MRKIIRLLILTAGLATASRAIPALADGNSPLYTQALKRMLASSYQGWSFTKTTTEAGKVTVEYYNGNKTKGQRWQLISLNSNKPTKSQVEKYLKKKRTELKKKEKAGKNDDDPNHFLATLVQPGSLKLIQQNPRRNIYRFHPVLDKNDKSMDPYIFGKMIIRRDNPLIEQIRIYNKQEFSAYHTKIKLFNQLMQFAPVDRTQPKTSPVFLISIENEIKGKAILLFSFEQKTSIKFSDYHQRATREPE